MMTKTIITITIGSSWLAIPMFSTVYVSKYFLSIISSGRSANPKIDPVIIRQSTQIRRSFFMSWHHWKAEAKRYNFRHWIITLTNCVALLSRSSSILHHVSFYFFQHEKYIKIYPVIEKRGECKETQYIKRGKTALTPPWTPNHELESFPAFVTYLFAVDIELKITI